MLYQRIDYCFLYILLSQNNVTSFSSFFITIFCLFKNTFLFGSNYRLSRSCKEMHSTVLCTLRSAFFNVHISQNKNKTRKLTLQHTLQLIWISLVHIHSWGVCVCVCSSRLRKSGEKGHHCLILSHGGKVFGLSPSNRFQLQVFVNVLYEVEKVSLYIYCLESFYYKWVLNFDFLTKFASIDTITGLFIVDS